MRTLLLILFIILLQNLLNAQVADTSLADKYLKRGALFLSKSSKTVKSENPYDTLNTRSEYDPALLDSSSFYLRKAQICYEKDKQWTKYLECTEKLGKFYNAKRLADSGIAVLRNGLRFVEINSDSGVEKYYKYYFILGGSYERRNFFDSAIINFKTSLSYILKVQPKNSSFIRSIFFTLGDCYLSKEAFDSSFYFYRCIMDSIYSNPLPPNYQIAQAYNRISSVFAAKNDIDKAIEYMEKAINVQKQTIHLAIGSFMNNLGNLYHNKGEYDKALECYLESIKLKLKDIGEDHFDIATTYSNIGLIYMEKGDYNKSLEYLNKCLFIREKRLGTNNILYSDVLNNLAYNYYYLGDLKNAELCTRKSIEITKSLYPDDEVYFSNYYITALIYCKAHKFNIADQYVKKCLNIINKDNSDSYGAALFYRLQGTFHLEQNFFDKAIESLEKSLHIFQKLLTSKHHPNILKLYNQIGDVYIKKLQYEKALDYFNSALINNNFSPQSDSENNFDNIISDYDLFNSLKNKYFLLQKLYKKTGNIDFLNSSFKTNITCINLFTKLRLSYKSDSSKVFITENSFDIFDSCIETALELEKFMVDSNYKKIAFDLAERSKNGILNGVLADSRAKKYANVPDSLLNYEDKLKHEIGNYSILIAQELENNKPDSIKLGYWQNRLFSLKERFLDYTRKLETNYPKYHNLKFQTHSISISEVQDSIDDNTALIEYFTGRNSIKIFTITKKDFNIKVVPIDSSFDDSVLKLYKTLKKQGNLIQKKNHEQFILYSSNIYNIIISPIYSNISNYSNLIFIPDGRLFSIPFEILMEKPISLGKYSDYNYLIKKHEISYHYSSTLCFEKNSTVNSNYDNLFRGFAPMFSKSDETNYLNSYRNSAKDLNYKVNNIEAQVETERLIFAEREVKSIDSLFRQKKQKSGIFLDKNANEYNFKNSSAVSSSKYLHIATHGIANEARPNLSALLFTQTKDPSLNDGILFAEEILNMNIRSELVILSACESGIGKYVKGEGMMAINRSFLYAGVRELIFSLWKVSDKHTCSLMIEFYKNVLNGQSFGAALKNAKLKMLSNEITAIPSNWSTFILVGK